MIADPATRSNAMKTCQITHSLVLAADSKASPPHRPMSQAVGQRNTLEMFGVGEYGRQAIRTKEPVGNGTKIYTT